MSLRGCEYTQHGDQSQLSVVRAGLIPPTCLYFSVLNLTPFFFTQSLVELIFFFVFCFYFIASCLHYMIVILAYSQGEVFIHGSYLALLFFYFLMGRE